MIKHHDKKQLKAERVGWKTVRPPHLVAQVADATMINKCVVERWERE